VVQRIALTQRHCFVRLQLEVGHDAMHERLPVPLTWQNHERYVTMHARLALLCCSFERICSAFLQVAEMLRDANVTVENQEESNKEAEVVVSWEEQKAAREAEVRGIIEPSVPSALGFIVLSRVVSGWWVVSGLGGVRFPRAIALDWYISLF